MIGVARSHLLISAEATPRPWPFAFVNSRHLSGQFDGSGKVAVCDCVGVLVCVRAMIDANAVPGCR
ncbi:hypothetical protein JCM10599A_04200 [Paraburkholderia kururiensis]